MMTLRQLATGPATIPVRTSWSISELAEARGRQELFARQSPQKLKVLREHALIESAISSNRIEGVEVDRSRIATLLFGQATVRDRDEEEVRGYRDALRLVHESGAKLSISEDTVRRLHRLSRGEVWDAGQYKDRDVDIVETYPDGRHRVRFETIPAAATPAAMTEMMDLWDRGIREKWVHPFVLMAALNLDFLCVHPFRDGNGRVSRLLFLLMCYHCGVEAGRYVSLERLVEEDKARYYEVLEQSSAGWHAGTHNPWPTIDFLLHVVVRACREFEERVGQTGSPRGEKTAMVVRTIEAIGGEFGLADLERQCPGVSRDMIRRVLRDLKAAGQVDCLGRGPGAKWRRRGNTPKGGNKRG